MVRHVTDPRNHEIGTISVSGKVNITIYKRILNHVGNICKELMAFPVFSSIVENGPKEAFPTPNPIFPLTRS